MVGPYIIWQSEAQGGCTNQLSAYLWQLSCFTWVEASPSCSYDNMLLLSQALMDEEQKPSSFSLVSPGDGRRPSRKRVFKCAKDVCVCTCACVCMFTVRSLEGNLIYFP